MLLLLHFYFSAEGIFKIEEVRAISNPSFDDIFLCFRIKNKLEQSARKNLVPLRVGSKVQSGKIH